MRAAHMNMIKSIYINEYLTMSAYLVVIYFVNDKRSIDDILLMGILQFSSYYYY